MKKYEKPSLIPIDVSEGVYASSGNCYSVMWNIHQEGEEGRVDYRIQFNGVHEAIDNHHSGEQILTINFNQPIDYKSSNGTCLGGSGTTVIQILYNYHNNGVDNIGLGDVVVTSNIGLAVVGAKLSCNHNCGQH